MSFSSCFLVLSATRSCFSQPEAPHGGDAAQNLVRSLNLSSFTLIGCSIPVVNSWWGSVATTGTIPANYADCCAQCDVDPLCDKFTFVQVRFGQGCPPLNSSIKGLPRLKHSSCSL